VVDSSFFFETGGFSFRISYFGSNTSSSSFVITIGTYHSLIAFILSFRVLYDDDIFSSRGNYGIHVRSFSLRDDKI
jgi:hypothetical protein